MNEFLRAVRLFEDDWPGAKARWATADPRLHAVTPDEPVERVMEVMPTAFGAMVRSILHQQVSIYAGRAIIGRLAAACGGGQIEAARVLQLSDAQMLGAGLSRGKVRYVRGLAEA